MTEQQMKNRKMLQDGADKFSRAGSAMIVPERFGTLYRRFKRNAEIARFI